MVKLASIAMSIPPESPAAFCLALSVLVGFCTIVASASGLVPRGYDDIDPRTMSCSIGFHQSEYQIESVNSPTQKIYDGK